MATTSAPNSGRLALAGILMPIWFLGFATLLGATRAGYDPLRDAISELGEQGAPNPFLWQLGGFLVAAGIEFAYAWALKAEFGARALFWLTALASGALAVAAGAPCDPGCPPVPTSPTMAVHTVAGLTFFGMLTVIPFAAWWSFRRRAGWRDLAWATLAVGVGLGVLFVVGPSLGADRIGVWQRSFLLIAFTWQGVVAWRLHARLRVPAREPLRAQP